MDTLANEVTAQTKCLFHHLDAVVALGLFRLCISGVLSPEALVWAVPADLQGGKAVSRG